jgi:hypothetical protein
MSNFMKSFKWFSSCCLLADRQAERETDRQREMDKLTGVFCNLFRMSQKQALPTFLFIHMYVLIKGTENDDCDVIFLLQDLPITRAYSSAKHEVLV